MSEFYQSPNEIKMAEAMGKDRNWPYSRFKEVMLTSAETGQKPLSYLMPESFDIQGLWPKINDLKSRTRETGLEHATPVFGDFGGDKRSLVTGKTTRGDEGSVRVDETKQPGREQKQELVFPIHTHPMEKTRINAAGHGFSDADFFNLLKGEEIATVMTYEDQAFMVFKTSATRSEPRTRGEMESISRRLSDLKKEFFTDSKEPSFMKIVNLNKAICLEFGLVLYVEDTKNKGIMRRVKVNG